MTRTEGAPPTKGSATRIDHDVVSALGFVDSSARSSVRIEHRFPKPEVAGSNPAGRSSQVPAGQSLTADPGHTPSARNRHRACGGLAWACQFGQDGASRARRVRGRNGWAAANNTLSRGTIGAGLEQPRSSRGDNAPFRGVAQALPLSFKSPRAQVRGFSGGRNLTLRASFRCSAGRLISFRANPRRQCRVPL